MIDVLELAPIGDDPPLAPKIALVLEAVVRLTDEVPGGWADERAVRKLLRRWQGRRAPLVGVAGQAGLIEKSSLRTDYFERLPKVAGEDRGASGKVTMIRLTDTGAVAHYAWRSDLLARQQGAGS